MGKKVEYTPNSQITSALRKLFLWSREHSATLKLHNRTCQLCGARASKAKGKEVDVHVHHINLIRWKELIDLIRDTLLCPPSRLMIMCKKCHLKEHEK